MYKGLTETLAHLASIKIQERYIVNGVKEEYITPDDLLEDLSSEFTFFQLKDFPDRIIKLKNNICNEAFDKLKELVSFTNDNKLFLENYTFNTLSTLIFKDPIWIKIREDSLCILNLINFNLKNWEKSYS